MSTNEAAARRSYSSKATVLTAKTSFAAAWSSELQPSTELSFSTGPDSGTAPAREVVLLARLSKRR